MLVGPPTNICYFTFTHTEFHTAAKHASRKWFYRRAGQNLVDLPLVWEEEERILYSVVF